MNELRRTKIVATLGPSTDDQSALVAMIRAGVDGVRINCSHGDRNDFIRRAWQAKDAAATAGRHVAVMFDIQALAFANSDEELNEWYRQHKELIGGLPEADRLRVVDAGREARARIARLSRTAVYTPQ